ncbi:YjcG family protein [Caldibacillus lycopersici]|uniref:Putative phosphoesterase OEV98_02400 n=1 Tax=Perspicuibacillus lycopersici TaxID=1325689 RepID=A0AAE3IQ78_9BACI|nr:YjcG family protein [Perspicuibacillus lycopersici]MCU9612412.1 YjcG family protein [Perspicuibacillus lycopersici]
MKVGIAIFPSKKLQDLANSYRKRYDPQYALIPPHITLKSAFELNEEELTEVSSELEKISEKFQPFTLNTKKISSFHPVNNVIFLKVEPTEELVGLHQAVNTSFFGGPAEYAFVPHITIGQQLSNSEHADVFGQLQLQKIEHQETIDRFHLLYQLDNEIWTVYETFLLGK